VHRSRVPVAALVAAALLALAPAASAHPGDWALSGAFERTVAPSFQGGFVPDDVDEVDVAFDNRAKTIALALRFFEAPTRGEVLVELGRAPGDGTCVTDAATIRITAADLTLVRTETVTERFWVPEQHRWTVSSSWPGTGWSYLGWDTWRARHHWLRAGYWDARTVTREVVDVDPSVHERTAVLERDGVAGALTATVRVGHGDVRLAFAFGHPLLDGLAADCLEIRVPGRLAPFTVVPPAAPAPAPEPAPAPAPPTEAGDPDLVDLEDVAVTATRRGALIELRLTGDAERLQVRVRGTARTLGFRPRVVLRGAPQAARWVVVRVGDGVEWSDWRRVPVRQPV